jgi:hypothetical protein
MNDFCPGGEIDQSSIVTIWQFRRLWSTIAASEVDLPEPVVPVTRIRPRIFGNEFNTAADRSLKF